MWGRGGCDASMPLACRLCLLASLPPLPAAAAFLMARLSLLCAHCCLPGVSVQVWMEHRYCFTKDEMLSRREWADVLKKGRGKVGAHASHVCTRFPMAPRAAG